MILTPSITGIFQRLDQRFCLALQHCVNYKRYYYKSRPKIYESSLIDRYLLSLSQISILVASQDITTSHHRRLKGQKSASHKFMDILDYIKFWCDAKKVPFYIPIPGISCCKQAWYRIYASNINCKFFNWFFLPVSW